MLNTAKRISYLILPFAMALTPVAANAKPETYTIDSAHTAVTFDIDHFGFSRPSGKFMGITGTVTLDEEAPQNSQVDVTIPVDQINTGVADLDTHLKSEDFFNVAEYPTAHFVSTQVELTGDKTATVTGDLTLKGITKPVTLNVQLNLIGENMFGKQTAGFSASGSFLRSEFGITTYLPALGDEVSILIDSEANK